MPAPSTSRVADDGMTILSRLLLAATNDVSIAAIPADLQWHEFEHLRTLADSNHVIVRGLEVFFALMLRAGDEMRADWAATALAAERQRIIHAISFLHTICAALAEAGQNVTVIKSFDHWPDLGSDLDLYTDGNQRKICALMQARFQAQMTPRSWGDRLAHKWNFLIPGLPEAVEIHMGRLGQTGEQVSITSWLADRAQSLSIGDLTFRVPASSDRLLISTLQRMYRHFYFRLCDIIDTARLSDLGGIDYRDLHSSASAAGIWKGVATYLVVVSDYLEQYRGYGLDLPGFVRASARFGGEVVYFERGFLRLPIIPQSARLYGSQLTAMLRRRELHNSARLSLLPWLATAALVGQKITGSDKGIW
jgi:hypothetical protein